MIKSVINYQLTRNISLTKHKQKRKPFICIQLRNEQRFVPGFVNNRLENWSQQT